MIVGDYVKLTTCPGFYGRVVGTYGASRWILWDGEHVPETHGEKNLAIMTVVERADLEDARRKMT